MIMLAQDSMTSCSKQLCMARSRVILRTESLNATKMTRPKQTRKKQEISLVSEIWVKNPFALCLELNLVSNL